MKNKKAIFSRSLFFVLCSLFFVTCSSLMDKTGKAIDGTAFKEKKIARYRALEKQGALLDMELLHAENKNGERLLVISQNKFPAVQIRTTEPDADGAFFVKSLHYISGNTSGWNQFSMGLNGTGKCTLNPDNAVFSINDDLEKVQVEQGKIRLFDTTIIGKEAVENLHNRAERIEALTEWMKGHGTAAKGTDRKAFEAFWKPILVPETCAKKKRPSDWLAEGDTFAKAEDINWNTGYTERVFPEELWPVRNSGTLLRDWEEAFEWIYFEYEWETLIGMLSRETTLTRVK